MKKIFALVVTVMLMCINIIPTHAENGDWLAIYVKAGAADGDGSFDRPYGDITQARDRIRKLKEEGKYPAAGVTVYLRAGTYASDKSVELGAEDSGTEKGPVVYRSYLEEQVDLVSGLQIDFSEASVVEDTTVLNRLRPEARGKVYYVDLKNYGITDYGELNIYGHGLYYYMYAEQSQLPGTNWTYPKKTPPEVFFGDYNMTLARWPNDGWVYTGKVVDPGDDIEFWWSMNKSNPRYVPPEKRVYPPKGSLFKADADTKSRMKNWTDAQDPWIFGYFKEDWSDIALAVEKFNLIDGTVKTKYPSPKKMTEGKHFYFFNMLEELDTSGEYYIDRSTGILYFYPPADSGKILVSLSTNPFFSVNNAEYINFTGLAFRGFLGSAIIVDSSRYINMELCTVSKTYNYGIMYKNCRDCTIRSCHVYDTGVGGIEITYKAGSEMRNEMVNNLTNMNMLIENCEINDYARVTKTYSPAVSMGGVGATVRNCKIYGADHYAISAGSNDGLIENCEFFDVLRTVDDSGVIYAGMSKHERGLLVRNNYFHDIVTSSGGLNPAVGVYMDDLQDGCTTESNLFVNMPNVVAMYTNGGRDNTLRYNVCVGINEVYGMNVGHYNTAVTGKGSKYIIENFSFLKYTDNPAYAKYPHFQELKYDKDWGGAKYNTAKDNVTYNCSAGITTNYSDRHKAIISYEDFMANNSIEQCVDIKGDPGFYDMSAGDYRIKEDSVIYKTIPKEKAPDITKMGLITTHLQHRMKGARAMLTGSPKAYAEFTPELIDDDVSIAPYMSGDVCYVPLRYIAGKFGAAIGYDEVQDTATVIKGSKLVKIQNGNIYIDGTLNKLKAQTVNGRTMIPLSIAEDILNIKAELYDGVIVFSDEGGHFSPENSFDMQMISELKRRLNNR